MSANVLGNLIRAQIYYRKTNKVEFAKEAGLSHSTISRIINGKILNPDLDTLIGLAHASKMNVAVMIALIRPNAFDSTEKDRLVSAWVDGLPETERKVVDLAFSSALIESDN